MLSGNPGEDVTRATGSTSQQARQQSREGKVVVVPVLNPDGTPAKDADGKVYTFYMHILLTVIAMKLKGYNISLKELLTCVCLNCYLDRL